MLYQTQASGNSGRPMEESIVVRRWSVASAAVVLALTAAGGSRVQNRTGVEAGGLIGWFVTWQVMENIDDLSDQIQDGIDELQRWLLDSPFHVTENQINDIAKNLREAISDNTDTITSAGLEGVTVIVEVKAVSSAVCHRHQCLNYLRAANLSLGSLLNFGRAHLEVGRVVYRF